MGRKHGNFQRKRKTIDLDSLGKKQRKLYRENGRSRFSQKLEEEESLREENENQIQKEEDNEDISSEEESNPYQQLVATFSSKPSTAIDSDENESDGSSDSVEEENDGEQMDEEQGEDDDDDGDDDDYDDDNYDEHDDDDVDDSIEDDKLADKIRKLEKKLKQTEEQSDIDSDLQDDESDDASDDDEEEEEEEDGVDDKLAEKIRKLEKKLKQVEEENDADSDIDDEGGGSHDYDVDDDDDDEDDVGDDDDDDQGDEGEEENVEGEDEDDETGVSEDNDDVGEDEDDGGNEDDDSAENVESSEDEVDMDDKAESSDISLSETDTFLSHYERDLDEAVVSEMSSCTKWKTENIKIPGIGDTKYLWSCDRQKNKVTHRKDKDLIKQHVKGSLCQSLAGLEKHGVQDDGLSSFQLGMFTIINNYQDILYTERTPTNGEEIRLVYCLHALNHVLKTRRRVITNNAKIKQKAKTTEDFDIRDQGLTRPKVLMILPFKESALRVVTMLIQLLGGSDKNMISKKKRFFEEYGLAEDERPKHSRKPEDYQELFSGNCEDHFRMGIGIAKKTMKLYTQFYKADIILASPLGLRTLIKTEGEKERDYDFLNSIEVMIIDQADVLMMQNWEHVLHLMNHIHLQPKESHGVDFSRVRMWTLNGWSKYYRQTLMFSSYSIPEINSLFNKHCYNHCGKYVCVRKPSTDTICQVAVQVPQVFHRIESLSYTAMPDDRFSFFVKKILPQHFDSLMAQTLIYIPSYFDFVRLRNHFTKEEIKYSSVNEYGSEKQVNTARNLFFQKLVPFMLYTERYHFFKRGYITGIRHIIFYGLPQYPHFYSEMCNMIQTTDAKSRGDNLTCTVLYTKYEAQKLAEIVGSDRAGTMVNSQKSVHMFVTGDND